MKTRLRIFSLKWLLPALFAAATGGDALAQSVDDQFEIVGHRLSEKPARVVLYVKAIRNGTPEKLNRDALRFTRTIDGQTEQVVVDTVVHQIAEQEVSASAPRENLRVLFLVAAGRAMPADALAQRRALVERIQQELETGGAPIQTYLGSYGNLAPRPQKLGDSTLLAAALAELESRPDSCAELYRAMVGATRFTRQNKGKWIIFLISDGRNIDNQREFSAQLPYTQDDVVGRFMPALGIGTFVIPIGIGARPDTAFFRAIVRATGNSADTFALNTIPANLRQLLGRRVDIKYNNIVSLYLDSRPIFKAEKRLYEGKWIGGPEGHKDGNYTLTAGTPSNPENPSKALSAWDWVFNWLAGLGIVGGALGLMATALPFINRRNFYKKYVRRYHKQPGVTKFDPVTRDELTEGEWVVVKCPRITTTLASWEHSKNKCPNYPRCLDNAVDPCDGPGAPSGNEKLFSGNRPLNWVWFGMVGGLIAWTLFAVLKNYGASWYNNLLLQLYGTKSGAGGLDEQSIANLANDTLLGAAFGAGICFTLSWAEERSQTRKLSWFRIALRTFLGSVLSLLVFFLGFYLQFEAIIESPMLSGLVTWLFFGLVIGAVLSVESSVGLGRGLLGGLLAALLAYGLYALMGNTDFGLAKLFSFILLGSVLGYTLVSVITRLEDFELEYVSPELFRQINPISKWLKRGIDISVGRESGNYVYVKWDDEAVQPVHARLFYDKGVVFIEPHAETLVNGRMLPLNTRTPLRHNDLIQYGRTSITRMRYREKRRGDAAPGRSGR